MGILEGKEYPPPPALSQNGQQTGNLFSLKAGNVLEYTNGNLLGQQPHVLSEMEWDKKPQVAETQWQAKNSYILYKFCYFFIEFKLSP